MTARELDALLIVSAVSLAAGMLAILWPTFLNWHRKPRPVREIERVR